MGRDGKRRPQGGGAGEQGAESHKCNFDGKTAAADNAAEVRRLLSAGRGVDEVGPGGVTPLIAAARHGAVGARWSARFDLCREVLDLIDSKARTTPAK